MGQIANDQPNDGQTSGEDICNGMKMFMLATSVDLYYRTLHKDGRARGVTAKAFVR